LNTSSPKSQKIPEESTVWQYFIFRGKLVASNYEENFMARVEKDEVREDRIAFEATVDANGPEEQAMGWYYYLDDKIVVPFKAKCITKRTISPLEVNEEVEVLGMAPESECEHEMFVRAKWQGRELDVPLAQIAVVEADEATQEAVEDWHYWVNRGYEF
jgi:hypothetical protein